MFLLIMWMKGDCCISNDVYNLTLISRTVCNSEQRETLKCLKRLECFMVFNVTVKHTDQ